MVFRVSKNKEHPYVMLDKRFLRDNTLSAKAKGILAYLLCLPDDWKIYETELTQHFSDGVKAINTGIKELLKAGYIRRDKIRDDSGRFKGYEYTVYETSTETPFSENGKTENGKRHTTNTNKPNKEELINNIIGVADDGDCFDIFIEAFQQYFGYAHRVIRQWPDSDAIDGIEGEDLARMYIEYFEKYGCNDKQRNLEKCSIDNVFASASRYEKNGGW